MTQNLKLSGRLAVVSGGGGAIGSEVARILSAAGAAIAILEVNPDSAAAIATEITAGGGRARAYICDICSYPAAEKTIQTVAAEMGPVDILVNVAGGSARAQAKRFHEQDMAVVEQVIRLNLFGTLHCIRATVNQMISRNYGKIINFGSSVGLGGLRSFSDYAAAKGAIFSLTKSLAMELGEYNINVNCVSPGPVRRKDEMPVDEAAFCRRTSWLNRLCTPRDIAEAVLFLAGPEADFITGQNLVVDGGRTLGLTGAGRT
ncbi:MAG: SDR family oxidoreductase [Lentisphaerae bacterium]|nr:SDR family oxidoreductase [Lentisphaerota bacterium]